MSLPVPEFIANLYDALDTVREERSLSWAGVAREVNTPFEFTTSRPIRASTISGMRARWAIEGDAVLQMLRWLKRPPESMLADCNGQDPYRCVLPNIDSHKILRFRTVQVFETIQIKRLQLDLNWEQTALAAGVESPNTLRHLRQGGRTGFPQILRIARWLNVPVVTFVHATTR